MSERRSFLDPYWQHDIAIETPPSYNLTGGFGFRFKVQEATERHGVSGSRMHRELLNVGLRARKKGATG